MQLTKNKLYSLLKEEGFVKVEVAKRLGVGEASIRRACTKFGIDCLEERKLHTVKQEHQQFKVKKSSSSLKSQEGRFVVLPDIHANTVIWDLLISVCEFIKDYNPEYVIQLGDLMDYGCLLGIAKRKYPSFDGKDMDSLNREFEACSKIISIINQACTTSTKKFILKGNHEYRADLLISRFPEFKSIFDLQARLDLGDWTVLPYLEKLKLGKLNFIHGEFYGNHPVKKHLEVYQKNVIFGHTHIIEQTSKPSPMREIPIWGASVGCLCTLNAEYMMNKSSRVEHGFAYGVIDKKTGDFFPNIQRIIRGRFFAEKKWYGVREQD